MRKIGPRYNDLVNCFAAVLAATLLTLSAQAQESPSNLPVAGRVDLYFADAPPATVEVDLKRGMLSAMTGIAKAAVEGVAEALVESGHAKSPAVQQSAEHLEAVNAILKLVGEVVHEVRVRVYEDLSEQAQPIHAAMVGHYQDKLHGTNWENIVRVRDHEDSVIVCVLQDNSVIQGVFVMVADGDDVVVANVVCHLTPDNVKQLTKQATQIGMKFGLEQVIEEAMREISDH